MKPENLLVGSLSSKKINSIYVVDFGLAKEYLVSGEHIPYIENKTLTGTVR